MRCQGAMVGTVRGRASGEPLCVHEAVTGLEREVVVARYGAATRYNTDGLPGIEVA